MRERLNDKRLLRLLAEGDEYAFRQLHDRYFSKLYAAALRYLPDQDAAYDLVQDIFIRLWENPQGFMSAENVEAYLKRTARNCALNAIKKQLNEAKARQAYDTEAARYEANPTQKYLDKADLEHALNETVKLLPNRQQQVYRLSVDEGLDYKEIAQRLQTSPRTVNVQLGAARKFVRQHLARCYHYYTSIQAYGMLLLIVISSR